MNWHTPAPFGELLTTWRARCHMTQTALASALGAHRNTIGRWERGDGLPETKGIVLEVAHLLRLDEQETRQLLEASLTTLAPYWTVPFRRNTCFTGHATLLKRIHALLAPTQPDTICQPLALSGLGGIGKTQLAVEYAYRFALEYKAVFWLAAETTESLMHSVQMIADQLQLPEHQEADQFRLVAAVQRWLTRYTGWLVIADNVEDLDLLQTVLPALRHGSLLLTTRRPSLGTLPEMLEIPPLLDEDGVNLVLRRSQHPGSSITVTEQETAMALVKLLDGLPLALDQAGAYIDETGCSITAYLQLFHLQRKQILARRGVHGGAHPASVAATLSLSVEHIEQEHPAAADLLRFCIFFHPEAIPEELFLEHPAPAKSTLALSDADPYQFDLTLAALRAASLVSRHGEAKTLSIHRLVQAVLHDQMNPVEVRLRGSRVIRALNAAFPEPAFPAWTLCERYLTHALVCIPLIEMPGNDLPEIGELLLKAGSYLIARGRPGEAEPLLQQAVDLGKQCYGMDHPALIPLLLKQAELFLLQGKYPSVETLFLNALSLGEHHLGTTHLQTAEALNDLATLYWMQGKYQQAEPLYQRALYIREQQLGNDHPDTALTMNNLATLYQKQGKYQQAEPLYQCALRIQEHLLGNDHPQVALTLNNLATLYRDQGQDDQGEQLYQRALRIREQQLGPEHLETLITLNNLATLYRDQGKYQQAKQLYQRVLSIREQQLGNDHPQIATTLGNLAILYTMQGKYEQAAPLYRRALDIRERKLGSDHPETVKIRNDYHSFLAQSNNLPGDVVAEDI